MNTYEYFFIGVKIVVWLAISDNLIYIDVHTTVVGPIGILGIGPFSCQRKLTNCLSWKRALSIYLIIKECPIITRQR